MQIWQHNGVLLFLFYLDLIIFIKAYYQMIMSIKMSFYLKHQNLLILVEPILYYHFNFAEFEYFLDFSIYCEFKNNLNFVLLHPFQILIILAIKYFPISSNQFFAFNYFDFYFNFNQHSLHFLIIPFFIYLQLQKLLSFEFLFLFH